MKEVATVRAALYARVSTNGKGQDPETQLAELRAAATQREWMIAGEFVDTGISGSRQSRPELDKKMKAARRGEFDAVMVYRFDRLARSVSHLLSALEEFQTLGIQFISLYEAVDTSTPMGKLLLTLVSAIAEFERSLIVERVRSGVARARRQGKRLRRPRREDIDLNRVRRLLASGQTVAAVAKMLEVPRGTLRSALARGGEKPALKKSDFAPVSP
jgi:DNA invertase Pin-like site-specific DNA recombinase